MKKKKGKKKMEFLKELFAEKALTFDELSKAANEKGLKLADLSGGAYVSKTKYDTDIQARDEQIMLIPWELRRASHSRRTRAPQKSLLPFSRPPRELPNRSATR